MALTLLDIAKLNGTDDLVGLIEESIQAHPELLGAARTIQGTSYRTRIRTALAGTGFRDANDGTNGVQNVYKNKLVETFISTPRIVVDVAVADSDEDGPEALMALEATGVMESEMRSLASQMWYGTSTAIATSVAANPTSGFPGMVDTYNTDIAVDMAGAGGDTSSIWAVKWGPRDVSWVYGVNGALDLSDTRVETVSGDNGEDMDAYVRTMKLYPGLQQVNINSAGRIRNIDGGTGIDDDDIANLLSLFPTGVTPDILYMTRRTLRLLRESRTATITNGGTDRGTPNLFPDSSLGIPIAVTDALVDTETAS